MLRVEREDVRARHDTLVRPAEDQAARPSSKTKQQERERCRQHEGGDGGHTYRTAAATRRSVSETVTQPNRQTRRDETTRDMQRAQAASSRGIQDKGSRTGRAGGSSAPTPPCSTRSARPRAPPRPAAARTHTRAHTHTHTYTTKAHVTRACLSEKATACCFCNKTRFQMLSYVSVCVPQSHRIQRLLCIHHSISHRIRQRALHSTARHSAINRNDMCRHR